jgi:hypothetical protein
MKSDKKNLENLDKTSMMIPFLKSWCPELANVVYSPLLKKNDVL